MSYAFCCVPVAPMRLTPNHQSEMISQLLFGEYCTIIDTTQKDWIKIICKIDSYQGWCQRAHLQTITDLTFNNSNNFLASNWLNEIEFNGTKMFIPFGSSVTIEGIKFISKPWDALNAKKTEANIKNIATQFLNTAYLWGGKSVFGIDCSGFAQLVYKFFSIALLRDAHQQATHGKVVNFLIEAQCGDLAFFDDEEGKIIHVGILLSNNQIIHAAGKVRIDKIDNAGIINIDTGKRTQKLRIIKRYF